MIEDFYDDDFYAFDSGAEPLALYADKFEDASNAMPCPSAVRGTEFHLQFSPPWSLRDGQLISPLLLRAKDILSRAARSGARWRQQP